MNATDDFGLAAASWPPTSLEAKILHISGDKFSKKMLKAGLVWNHEPTLAPGKLIENERALAAAKRAWAKGDTELWVPTSVPEKPLTLPNLQALTLNLEFAVRRAVDGDRPSQEIVLAALELSDRLVRVADVARRNIRHDDQQALYVARHVSEMVMINARSIIGYLVRNRGFATVTTTPENLTEVPDPLIDQLERLIRSHKFLDRCWDKTGEEIPRAVFYSQRLKAQTSVGALIGSRADALAPSSDDLNVAEAVFEAALPADPAGQLTDKDLQDISLAKEHIRWMRSGDDSQFGKVLIEMSARGDLLTHERIDFLRTAANLIDTPEASLDVVTSVMAIIDSQPPEARNHLLARSTELLSDFIAKASEHKPRESSIAAGRIGGFGHTRDDWDTKNHVWLLPSRQGVVAIADHDGEVKRIPLPGLDDTTLAQLTLQHAEEYDDSNNLGGLRKKLARQVQPLAHYIADGSGSFTVYGFRRLKHIPIAALTGKGAILAISPGMSVLSKRRAQHDLPTPTTQRRRVVVDESLGYTPSANESNDTVVQFDSTDNRPLAEVENNVCEALRPGASEFVFFGHGFVDQFRADHFGLLIQEEKEEYHFVPANRIAQNDYRNTRFALIIACSAGQSSVFTSSQMSVADAFCAAGCEVVVAPIWPIEVSVGKAFCGKFLDSIDEGESAQDAWAKILAQDPHRFVAFTCFT